MKILLTAGNSLNKGEEARVLSFSKMIRTLIPNIQISLLSFQPEVDKKIYEKYNIQIIKKYRYIPRSKSNILQNFFKGIELLFILFDAFLWRISNKFFGTFLSKELQQYDMFIDINGESLSDYYFGVIEPLFCLHQLLLGIILKKKVVIYAQSLGPMINRSEIIIIRFVLNMVDLITVRDTKSLKYLTKYSINKPTIYLTADPAFILESAPAERLNEIMNLEGIARNGKTLVGLSVGRGSYKRSVSNTNDLRMQYKNFLKIIAVTVDYLVEQLHSEVIFIPHVIIPDENDRIVFREIYQNVENKNELRLISGDYNCEELKGIIGKCELFIGTRMHANIAALTMFVPTIAIAYSHKMLTLMEELELSNYCCEVSTISLDELISKINEAWQNKEVIKRELIQKIEKIKNKTEINAQLVKDLLLK